MIVQQQTNKNVTKYYQIKENETLAGPLRSQESKDAVGGEDTRGVETKRSTSPSFIRNKPSFAENEIGFLDSVKSANF